MELFTLKAEINLLLIEMSKNIKKATEFTHILKID